MAQDPEADEEREDSFDLSHDMDTVTLYDSTTVDAEIEADVIRGLLDANGIPSILIRPFGLAPLGYEIKVPRAMLQDAKRVIAEAEAAGPEAAAEAEAASEQQGS